MTPASISAVASSSSRPSPRPPPPSPPPSPRAKPPVFPPLEPPPPHVMCSPYELDDRFRHMEISEFECSPDSSSSSSSSSSFRDRKPDSRLVVKKYRRSAAGGGAKARDDDWRRTASDLGTTVDYLLGYLLPRRTSAKEEEDDAKKKKSDLSKIVSFVDDRLRAVQSDFVTLLGVTSSSLDDDEKEEDRRRIARRMQARIVRYNVLIRYLLTDVDSTKYERKFGGRALRTAIGSYFDSFDNDECDDDDAEEERVRDEMMSYAALLRISSVLISRETALPRRAAGGGGGGFGDDGDGDAGGGGEGGGGYASLLSSYRSQAAPPARTLSAEASDDPPELTAEDANDENDGRDERKTTKTEKEGKGGGEASRYPKWRFATSVAAAADEGNYRRVLLLLASDGYDVAVAPAKSSDASFDLDDETKRWKVLCRCCVSRSLNVVRLGSLRRYNRSFMKNEKVSGEELARLLCLPNPESAIRFCTAAGLPTAAAVGAATTTTSSSSRPDRVVMKAAPISIEGSKNVDAMVRPPRSDEDSFVFGKNASDAWRRRTDDDDGRKKTAWDDDEVKDGESRPDEGRRSDSNDADADGSSPSSSSFVARVDGDRVTIPPAEFFWSILR